MCGVGFAERAASILSLFLPDIETLPALTEDAYDPFDGDPAPLVKVDENLFFLELWHGPTCSFEDIAFAVLTRARARLSGESDGALAIAPLIACYFSAYADLIDAGEIDYGDEVNFCVPYGDGSLLAAGYYASCMGLSVGKLICALGENEPADLSGTGVPRERLAIFRVGEEEIADTIGYAFDEYGYLPDPQSAVAVAASEEYAESADDERVTVVLSTQSPHRAASAVLSAIGEKSTGNLRRDCLLLEEVTACEAPEVLIKPQEKATLFTDTIQADALADALKSFAGKTGK